MFDKSNKSSFQSVSCLLETLHELQKQYQKSDNFYRPSIIVIGNKADLKANPQGGILKTEDIREIREMGYKVGFISAQKNLGCNECLE